jgi:hypothetical protein
MSASSPTSPTATALEHVNPIPTAIALTNPNTTFPFSADLKQLKSQLEMN